MSATTASRGAPAAAGAGDGGARPASGRRRGRLATAGIVLVVLAAGLAAWGSDGPEHDGALDPQNPGPDGARAVARVLDRSGVDVTVARGAEQLAGALDDGPPERTTVVVTGTGDLGPTTADGLLDAAAGTDLVVVAPGSQAAELLDLPGPPSSAGVVDDLPADCPDPGVRDLRLADDATFAYPGAGCFAVDTGVLLARDGATTVLGAPGVLTNARVLRADNAALALRLLGGDERLVWYVPDVADLDGGDPVGVAGLLPDWLQPGLALLALAAVAAMLWRGRRLGPLATEPLPVTVRALETTQGRGRLYHRGRDRAHAARVLRRGTRRRTAAALGLTGSAAGPDPGALVAALARATGRQTDELRALVADDAPPPRGDDDLTMLATSLAELEREVRPS